MSDGVRFIHAADLHLGAPVRGLRDVSPEWVARLQGAIAEAYGRVIDAALANDVDFVVFAGDVFDTSRPSYGDYLRFFTGLERLDAAGIPAYIVAGNHDPFTTWAPDVDRLPASAQLLGANGPEFALFKRDGEPICLIGGRSYYNQSWPEGDSIAAGISREAAVRALEIGAAKAGAPAAEAGAEGGARVGDSHAMAGDLCAAKTPLMVGIIHTGLDIDVQKAPSDLGELLESDVDYWACGHLHKRCVFPSEADPRVVFSGCVQGRDIKETGERGCYLVELGDGGPSGQSGPGGPDGPAAAPSRSSRSSRVSLTFIPTSSVVLEQMQVDVSACQTLADVARLVRAQLFHENGKMLSDEMVVRVTLTGETALHGFLRRREILDDLRKHINNAYPSFFCDALVDGTRPADGGPGGVFSAIVVDMADEQRGREDVMINYVQNEFVKRGIAVPSALSRRVDVFNDAAEALVLDLLRADSEGDDGGGEAGGAGGAGDVAGDGGVPAVGDVAGAGDRDEGDAEAIGRGREGGGA